MFRQGFWRRWWWLSVLLVFDVLLATWWFGRDPQEAEDAENMSPVLPLPELLLEEPVLAVPVAVPLQFGFPTAQTHLMLAGDETVFMPTASGRGESALYGTVRTQNKGGHILPSFHEGVDIAPLQRDRRGHALDTVQAVADGTVAYINRRSGNSNYGNYVVLEHSDPVGSIYTLYAHLSAVDKTLREGVRITRGGLIGVMGNTPSIPVGRSHVHLEIGMIRNRRFAAWAAGQKIDNRHGQYNGWNLTGVHPLALYSTTAPERSFSMLDYLSALPPAFELLLAASKPLDYFARYPALWHGEGLAKGELVLSVSEGGVITRGRPATAAECEQLTGRALSAVLAVDKDVLGRNGLRLVVERSGHWELGENGRKWLEVLLY